MTGEKIRTAHIAAKEKLKRIIESNGGDEVISSSEYLETLKQEILAQMELEELTLGIARELRKAEDEQKKIDCDWNKPHAAKYLKEPYHSL